MSYLSYVDDEDLQVHRAVLVLLKQLNSLSFFTVNHCLRARMWSGQRAWRQNSLSNVTLLWPVISILPVSLERNQGQEICFLPKLKKYVETRCAPSTNASCHHLVQQTETGRSKDAPGILAGCHPFCCYVSWWDLSLDQKKSACNSWPLDGRKQPEAIMVELTLGKMWNGAPAALLLHMLLPQSTFQPLRIPHGKIQ